jgi:hypothetical protein
MTWNPFTKAPGEQLTTEDLTDLIGRVAEGYYVEYKETFPTPKKIAHSIASLANTYGGWYIVGVKADQFDYAAEICGFSVVEFPDPVSKVRDVVKSRIDPVPVFYPMRVPLENSMAVLVVYVPGEQHTPFITDDGRVYRRNHASSDPVPENSRHTLDRLVEDGKHAGGRFVDFCRRTERTPPKIQMLNTTPVGWFNLFLALDPEPFRYSKVKTVAEMIELSQRTHPFKIVSEFSGSGNIPFRSGHTTPNSVVLRQSEPGSATSKETSAEFSLDGYARLSIPVPHPHLRDIAQQMTRNAAAAQALRLVAHAQRGTYLSVFDGALIPVQALVFTSLYAALQEQLEWSPRLRFAFSFLGLGGTAPIVDTIQWAEQVAATGIPLLEDEIRYPDNWSDSVAVPFDEESGMIIAITVARAMGLRPEVAVSGLITADGNSVA